MDNHFVSGVFFACALYELRAIVRRLEMTLQEMGRFPEVRVNLPWAMQKPRFFLNEYVRRRVRLAGQLQVICGTREQGLPSNRLLGRQAFLLGAESIVNANLRKISELRTTNSGCVKSLY